MNAVIEDPMGLESGIRIDMVKTVTDRKAGRDHDSREDDCLYRVARCAGH